MPHVDLTEEEFIALKRKKLLELFKEKKSISVYVDKHKLNLYYTSGIQINKKYVMFIYLTHLKEIPELFQYNNEEIPYNAMYHYPEEVIYSTVLFKILSPFEPEKAVNTLIRYYKNLKANKKSIIKELTKEEIDNIVYQLNTA